MSTGTDSQVASRVVDKGIAKTYPMCCIAMELHALMEARGLWLHNEWTPRELNEEADALSNEEFAGFDPSLRVNVDLEYLPWLVLPGLLQEGLEWHRQHGGRRAPPDHGLRRKRRKPLRERDPW